MLDEVMKSGTAPQADHLLQFETRSLRDTRQLLNTVSLADTLQFVEQNPHPRYTDSTDLVQSHWVFDKGTTLNPKFSKIQVFQLIAMYM